MPNLSSARNDPLRGFKFQVVIGGYSYGFSRVTGLKEDTEIVAYREGTDQLSPRKLPGLTNYDNVTFEKGLGRDPLLINWRQQVIDIARSGNMMADGIAAFRQDIMIHLHSKTNDLVRSWIMKNAWPASLEWSDLDANSSDVVIETCTFAHEGLVYVASGSNAGAAGSSLGGNFKSNLVAGVKGAVGNLFSGAAQSLVNKLFG